MKLAAYSGLIAGILLLNSSLSADQSDTVSDTQENVGDAFSAPKNNDSQIQMQLQNSLRSSYGKYRVTAHVFNGNVILTGQVYNEQDKDRSSAKWHKGPAGSKK